jgi:predicted transcriptional regulator
MPRKPSETLTDAELRVMEVLWNRGEATVADAVDVLAEQTPLAYSSVLTTMRILEKKGYATHRQEGRAFVYAPVVDRKEARRSAIRHVLSRFFDNSPELLVLNVLEEKSLDAKEIQRLRRLVDASERKGAK